MIDINIVEADRDRIRDLGLSLGTVNPSTGSITPGLGVGGGLCSSPRRYHYQHDFERATVGASAINALTYKDIAVILPGVTAAGGFER